jgi:hypothetical protein
LHYLLSVVVFAPAGYAFAIWGVIYLGELVVSLYSGIIGKPSGVLQRAVFWWLTGNLFQSLWCAAFRPVLIGALWLSALLLGLGAISFIMVHNVLTMAAFDKTQSWHTQLGLLALRVPIALHSGWMCAATLLNINSWAAVSKIPMSQQVALAMASSYVGSGLGLYLSVRQRDPFIALTVSWALAAVAYETEFNNPIKLATETREALYLTENLLAKGLVAVAVAIPAVAYTVRF